MIKDKIPIGQVKRDISELVNRVAFGGERIILTSRGKPKAVLVSIEDLQQLEATNTHTINDAWNKLMAQSEQLNKTILTRRNEDVIDADLLWQSAKEDLEGRTADYVSD